MEDSFYTPKHLAESLVSYLPWDDINTIADFCIGDGELVRAAIKKWPNAKCFGSDLSSEAIRHVEGRHKDWRLCRCNFLDSSSRKAAIKFGLTPQGFDLIVLNPPFSCVGGSRFPVVLDSQNYQVSKAMAFVAEAIKFLSPKGNLLAILPRSVGYSNKDREIWAKLISDYNLTILEEPKNKPFKGCSPSVILVSIGHRQPMPNSASPIIVTKLQTSIKPIGIFRGKFQMYRKKILSPDGFPLVHSTNLQNNRLVNLSYEIKQNGSLISGPAVLLPRVGSIKESKICPILSDEAYILSDCVLAIKTQSNNDSIVLCNDLMEGIADLKSLYTGTGSKYVTIEKLEWFLGLTSNSLDDIKQIRCNSILSQFPVVHSTSYSVVSVSKPS